MTKRTRPMALIAVCLLAFGVESESVLFESTLARAIKGSDIYSDASSRSRLGEKAQEGKADRPRAGLCWPEPNQISLPPLWSVKRNIDAELVVNEEGTVDDVKLSSSYGGRATDTVIARELLKWNFKPALKDSKPVKVRAKVRLVYEKTQVTVVFPHLRRYAQCSPQAQMDYTPNS